MNSHDHLVMERDHMDKLYRDPNKLISFGHLKRLKVMVDILPSKANLRILDAGCGEGHLLAQIKLKNQQAQLFGIDVTNIALTQAREKLPEADFTLGDICRMDYKDDFFDVVTCSQVLEHIHDYRQALGQLIRIVRPGGLLIVTFPNELLFTFLRFVFGRRPIKVPDHVNSFTPAELIGLVNLRVIKRLGLPLAGPFFISPQYLLAFKK